MSLSVAVLAREGRGGGVGEPLCMPLDLEFEVGEETKMLSLAFAAKGSGSLMRGLGLANERLCLRVRGLGFWSELRILGADVGEDSEVGVLDLIEDVEVGGGGACRAGA